MRFNLMQLAFNLFLAIANGAIALMNVGNKNAWMHPVVSLIIALLCAFTAGLFFNDVARQFFKKD